MQWVDHEAYVGPCRRVARRPHLQHRRRKNYAQPSAPNPRLLFAQVAFARQLGREAGGARTIMRIEAGVDLAERVGDLQIAEAFRALRTADLLTENALVGQ